MYSFSHLTEQNVESSNTNWHINYKTQEISLPTFPNVGNNYTKITWNKIYTKTISPQFLRL